MEEVEKTILGNEKMKYRQATCSSNNFDQLRIRNVIAKEKKILLQKWLKQK